MERSEQLARKMFEAYNEKAGGKTFDGRPIPPWEQIGKTQENWIAAAETALEFSKSDGYHTFDELYDHRNLLYFNLCFLANHYGAALVYKSLFNSDGEPLGDWCLVYLVGNWDTVENNLISYHLPISYWDKLYFASELEPPFFYDGHTSDDVLKRLEKLSIGFHSDKVPYYRNARKMKDC